MYQHGLLSPRALAMRSWRERPPTQEVKRMGMKQRRRPRARKVPISRRAPGPGDASAHVCAGEWEFWVTYDPQLAPHIAVGADVSLYPGGGKVVVMIGTSEVAYLADPAVPQLIDCVDLGYVFTGTVMQVIEEDHRARLSVSGARTDKYT